MVVRKARGPFVALAGIVAALCGPPARSAPQLIPINPCPAPAVFLPDGGLGLIGRVVTGTCRDPSTSDEYHAVVWNDGVATELDSAHAD